jgi:RNA-directed DNA polymerase
MNTLQYKKNEIKKFCTLINVKPIDLEPIIENIDFFYKEMVEEKVDKLGTPKKYKDGTIKTRNIRPSKNELKIIQSRIKNNILSAIPLPDFVHGGVKKKSNITNAKKHQGNKYILTTDLQEFYPSIKSKRVYNTFVKLGYSTHFSRLLSKLTTWKYELPQGTPTSPHIANIVFLDTDKLLKDLCDKNEITYTRYVDDLTFSSQKDFKYLHSEILNIVTSNDFKISQRKTYYKPKQLITGIVVSNHKIDAPQNIIDKVNIEIESNNPVKSYQHYLNQIRKTNIKKKSKPK